MEDLKKELLRLQNLEKSFKEAYEEYIMFDDDEKLRILSYELNN